jgi:hypothetical protein
VNLLDGLKLGQYLVPLSVGTAVLSSFSSLSLLLLVGALNSLLPPPKHRNTQLPHRDHPFCPYYRQTGLIEYVQDSVWVAQQPLSFYGKQFGARMTVLKIEKDDELVVYSPIRLTESIKQEIEELGNVAYIIAPNCLHHLFLDEWIAAYPNCQTFVGPDVLKRRPDLLDQQTQIVELGKTEDRFRTNRLLSDCKDIEFVAFHGHAFLNEIVLFHRPSSTLMVCDMIENFSSLDIPSWRDRLGLSMALMLDRPTPPNDWKLTVEDQEAIKNTVEAILSWDFNRIVIAHGRLIEKNAKAIFRDAFAFVL